MYVLGGIRKYVLQQVGHDEHEHGDETLQEAVLDEHEQHRQRGLAEQDLRI